MRSSEYRIRSYVVFAIFFFLYGSVLAEDSKPIETDLCKIVAHSNQFNKKRVRLKATVESAIIEGGTWLHSDACPAAAIELSVPESIRENPAYEALDNAIRHQGNIGTVGKKITAIFTGEFTFHFKRPKHVLTLEKIEDLDVKIKNQ
jgi:hypothetical protein